MITFPIFSTKCFTHLFEQHSTITGRICYLNVGGRSLEVAIYGKRNGGREVGGRGVEGLRKLFTTGRLTFLNPVEEVATESVQSGIVGGFIG